MNRYLKLCFYLLAVSLLASSLLLNINCAGSKATKFHTKIQSMSDNDILNYYHGICERINDIDRSINREANSDQTDQERLISNRPFIIGGKGYNLIQKRKIILNELNKRALNPSTQE